MPFSFSLFILLFTVAMGTPVFFEISLVESLEFSFNTSIIDRLISPKSLPLFAAMPLQDAIDYAIYLIRTTIDSLRFEPRFPTVGGAIDVLVITPQEKPYFVQKKELIGE